jgi:hypothetical protein
MNHTSLDDMLQPLSAVVKARRYLVLDIETKDGETQKGGFTRPFLAGFFDGQSYVDWRGKNCLELLLAHILRKEFSGHYVYGHNAGGFDYLHMLPCFMALDDEYDIELIPVASTIQALRVRKGRLNWTFLDSYKLIPTGLEKAAKALGSEITKEEGFDYDLPEDDPRWQVYLERDCRALYSVLESFHAIIEEELGGEVGMTLASTSMKTFRRGYLACAIERASHCHDFVRRGYYGGNTQMFLRHAEGLHYYDINSSYPAAMLGPVPVKYLGELEGKPSMMVRSAAVGMVEAIVDWDDDMPFPSLPYRMPQGKLVHPAGVFKGVWSSEELEYAESLGCQVTWLKGHWFNTAQVLADYMRALYAYRDKSSPNYREPIAYVAKLLANSLYGKFGQNPIRERIVITSGDEDYPLEARPANDDDDCRIFYVVEESDADYIIPQIAAVITARGRINLHKFIMNAWRQDGLIAYCDTDSILTTADLSEFCGTELGMLKDEGNGCTFTGDFIQPKLYRLVNEQTSEVKIAMKGFRDRTDEVFEKARSGETIYRQELEKLGALAQAGFRRGPLMREVSKSIKSTDTKRLWLPDGTSKPIVIEEDI